MEFQDRGIKGPDISFYQGSPRNNQFVDFQKMKAAGVDFVIIRAGQYTYEDTAFAVNWKNAKEAGIPRAAYFFLDKDGDARKQAQFFWSLMQPDPGEGPLIVDFEGGSGDGEHLYNFLYEFSRLSQYPDERIWIYTGYYYWLEFTFNDTFRSWFDGFPLWIAWYESVDRVQVPYPWTKAVMWQRGVTIVWGPDYGVHSLELDWNSFNGGVEEFQKYFKTDYVPTPNEGGNVMQYKVVWPQGVARRAGPATTYSSYVNGVPLTYPSGTVAEVVEENIPDAVDPINTHKKWVKFSDGRYGASEYPDSTGVPRVRMQKIEDPAPVPERRAYSLKVEGYKEVTGYLEPE